MEIERVQRWVMSALMATVAVILATGLALLSENSPERPGSRAGLLVIAGVIGVLAVLGVRVIHQKRLVTPWLMLGPAPALIGWYFVSR